MRLSQAGAHLIESFEGFVPHPYRDAVGVWTIGFGSTKGVGPNSPRVTIAEAEARLMREVDAEYGAVINALGLPLSQYQFDALVSFVYNVGTGGVSASTQVGRALRARNWQAAADHLLDWDKAGGRRLAGLTRRRHAERDLFLRTPAVDPLDGYRADEQRWIHEYDHLHRLDQNPHRRMVLRVVMTKRRKVIWATAQPEPRGEGGGWDAAKRRQRYRSMLVRSHYQ
jgi:GH24 family phage-related lysozyme (muramidase)